VFLERSEVPYMGTSLAPHSLTRKGDLKMPAVSLLIIKKRRENARLVYSGRSKKGRVIDSGLVRSHEERRCSNLGPTQSRISPSIL